MAASTAPAPPDAALRSVHTSNLPDIFRQLRISLVVSTYQAGKVILIRAEGETLNTHFRPFAKPMGIAVDGNRLTVGGTNTVWHYHNVPDVAHKLEPPGKHDACYLPRRIHVTGDIDIHELAWGRANELWLVNTRFGCLCTLDPDHSFTPRWRPPFLSALAAEDRCHLNGLGLYAGRPKFVTALGQTDTAGGWRANKANGGILMDIETNAVLLRGLSMPHSPRWHQDRLWLLESGQGSLALADPAAGSRQTVAELPGFTRGLDFYGPLAFIGLSQVRESAVFSGIPLVKKLRERHCGIWVVHIETGQTVGFLRFEAGVREIFAVQVLRDTVFPELLEWDSPHLATSYVVPDAALAEVFVPGPEDLAKSPAHFFQKAAALYRQGKLAEAIAAYRHCLRLDAAFPNARYDLGVALGDAGHYREAENCLHEVLKKEPERVEALRGLGYLAWRRRRVQQAVEYYRQAIALRSDDAIAHVHLGILLLLLGDYPRGFAEYEWRWRAGVSQPFPWPQPRWQGQVLDGQTLLVLATTGAADAIQFARFLAPAAERAGTILVATEPELFPLFAVLPGVAGVRKPGAVRVADFDVYAPLSSLPGIFGVTRASVPADTPYFDLAAFRRRTSDRSMPVPSGGLRKVGIVWAVAEGGEARSSCPPGDFAACLELPGIEFYSLQGGAEGRDLASLPSTLRSLDEVPGDYGEWALWVSRMDLVIGVDHPFVHLAGALGVPVWTLLAHVPDWRWGLEGETTPWYPAMRLFRQAREGDWQEVTARVAKALECMASSVWRA